MHGSPVSSRRTSVGSPFSQHHHRDMLLSSITSPLDSPPEGFRVPQWTPLSHGASVEDFVAAAEPLSGMSSLTSANEACILSEIPYNTSSNSIRPAKDVVMAASKRPHKYLYRSLSRHCLSKFRSRHLCGREKVDGRLQSEHGRSFQEGAASQHEDNGKQPMTLSQLVASSTREAFGWSDVNGISRLSWTLDDEGSITCIDPSFERIRADCFQPDDGSNAVESDYALEACSLCSKSLMHRSPWSSQRYVGSNDLPVVSILACGHVFHAECLEKVVPDVSNDPPCPSCKQPASKMFALRFSVVKQAIQPLTKQLARVLKAKPSVGQIPPSSFLKTRKGVFARSLSLQGNFRRRLETTQS